MAGRKVNIVLKARDEASKVLENAANNSLPAFAKRVAGLAAGFVSINAGINILKSAVEKALDAEKATAGLAAALRAQGANAQAALPHLTAMSTALSRLSLADDEAIQGAQKLLVSLGGLTGGVLDRATKAALDLSAGLGIDLAQAAEMVAKAANGSVKPFTLLGFEFQKNATDGEKLESVLAGIQQRFGGMAASEIKTASGQLHELNEAFGELLETLGTKIVVGADGVSKFTKALQDLNDEANNPRAEGFWTSLGKIIAGYQLGNGELALQRVSEDVARAASEMKQLSENADQDKLENPMIGFSDAAALAAKNLKDAADRAAELAAQQEIIDKIVAGNDFKTYAPKEKSKLAPITGSSISYNLNAFVNADAALAKQNAEWEKMVAIIGNATDGLIQYGEQIAVVGDQTMTLGETISVALRDYATSAALQLGDTLVDAAFGAKVAWDQVLKDILRGLIKVVIEAMILKAIKAAIGGGAGAALSDGGIVGGYADGGIATKYAAGGMFVPRGTDSVPAMLTPGEAVLTRGITHDILGGRASVVPAGTTGGSVINIYALDSQSFASALRNNSAAVIDVMSYIDARRG